MPRSGSRATRSPAGTGGIPAAPRPTRARALAQVAVIPRFSLAVTTETLGAPRRPVRRRARATACTSTRTSTRTTGTATARSRRCATSTASSATSTPTTGASWPGRAAAARACSGRRSILAHAVHCHDRELDRLAETGSSIAHCPTSQLFLGSGTMPWRRTVASGVDVAIGTDIGAGDEWLIPRVLNDCFKVHMSEPGADAEALHPAQLLFLGTLAGARALDQEALDRQPRRRQGGRLRGRGCRGAARPRRVARRGGRARRRVAPVHPADGHARAARSPRCSCAAPRVVAYAAWPSVVGPRRVVRGPSGPRRAPTTGVRRSGREHRVHRRADRRPPVQRRDLEHDRRADDLPPQRRPDLVRGPDRPARSPARRRGSAPASRPAGRPGAPRSWPCRTRGRTPPTPVSRGSFPALRIGTSPTSAARDAAPASTNPRASMPATASNRAGERREQRVDHRAERGGIGEQRRQVAEHDAGLGVVRDRRDQRLRAIERGGFVHAGHPSDVDYTCSASPAAAALRQRERNMQAFAVPWSDDFHARGHARGHAGRHRRACASTPGSEWWRSAVIYQIYPRSFADANGDGVGDLPGVTSRLDDLQRLGIDAIWLSPFMTSPQKDAGYDVADYCDVDPLFGTLADFDALLAGAHARGIRVIVDLVPNHSSDQHVWFQEALAAGPGSPERARYLFRDGKGENGELPPNNWESVFGGPAVDPHDQPRRHARPVVPAHLRHDPARLRLVEPRRVGGVPPHPALLARPRRRRLPRRRGPRPDEGRWPPRLHPAGGCRIHGRRRGERALLGPGQRARGVPRLAQGARRVRRRPGALRRGVAPDDREDGPLGAPRRDAPGLQLHLPRDRRGMPRPSARSSTTRSAASPRSAPRARGCSPTTTSCGTRRGSR